MPGRPASSARHGPMGRLVLALTLGLLLTIPGVTAGRGQPETAEPAGVTTLTGSVAVTNPLLFESVTEPYVLLLELTNFVRRDIDGEPPADSQVTARLDGDLRDASFAMPLPIAPRGTLVDLDRDAEGDGVQVYSVELSNNFVGDPFYGPFESELGWGTAYSSLRVENGTYEVVGGRVVVWAPDDGQRFPAGFGPDGRLFTDDDPLAPIPNGWTVVDLDRQPFAQLRDGTVEVPIIEGDHGLKDLSALSYTEAFDALVAELRLRYPFTQHKGIDWDAIVAEVRPRVERAERNQDVLAFNVALMRFAVLVGDGHVDVEPPVPYLRRRYGGGLGLTLGQTDDGAVIVRAVAKGSPAARAGIEVGAEVLEWDGQPVADALAAQELVRSASSPHTVELQRLRLLPRREVGAELGVVYRNPGGEAATVTLRAVEDRAGLRATFGRVSDNPAALPITVEVLDSGVGYVRINTFFDDLALIAHAWDWAIERLGELGAPALIVDVRGNGGGAMALATYVAGSFTTEPFALAENRFADETGELVFAGTIEVAPAPRRWERPVALLVDERCASACEILAAALARDPAHLIVGQHPTAGVEGAVYLWRLPGDLLFQAPLGLLEANGEVFVEGTGVAPTVDVPITRESLTTNDDVVLAAAEAALVPMIAAAASTPEPDLGLPTSDGAP